MNLRIIAFSLIATSAFAKTAAFVNPRDLKAALSTALGKSDKPGIASLFSKKAYLGVCESEADEVSSEKIGDYLANEINPGGMQKELPKFEIIEKAEKESSIFFIRGLKAGSVYKIYAGKRGNRWIANEVVSCGIDQAKDEKSWAPLFSTGK